MKFEEPRALNSVSEFHNTFGLPVVDNPVIPSRERCELRVNLLQEELNELSQAIREKDIVEVADALSDLQYVLSGAVLEFGLAGRFKALFDEVHRSNMSKTCASEEEARETVKHYREIKDEEGYIELKNDKFIVYRKGDGKVLKSVKYSAADLKRIF